MYLYFKTKIERKLNYVGICIMSLIIQEWEKLEKKLNYAKIENVMCVCVCLRDFKKQNKNKFDIIKRRNNLFHLVID